MGESEEIPSISDLLFELSNEIRYNILKLIKTSPKRPSVIASQLGLTPPEVSRNFSRLNESKMITKDVDNHYSITNLGDHVLNLLEEMEFMTLHKDYFVSHCSVKIPKKFQKRISELSTYSMLTSFMEFVTSINEIINESKDFIWLYIDQYPLIALDAIKSSLEDGVEIRIIEQQNLLGPEIVFEKKYLVDRPDTVPTIQIRTQDECDVYLVVSDAGSVVAFPTVNGFDYSGFVSKNNHEASWGVELYNHYWDYSEKADLDQILETPDTIELSDVIYSQKRADEWVKLFSRLSWSE